MALTPEQQKVLDSLTDFDLEEYVFARKMAERRRNSDLVNLSNDLEEYSR